MHGGLRIDQAAQVQKNRIEASLVGGWASHSKNMPVKLDHFPKGSGWKAKKIWKHHLDVRSIFIKFCPPKMRIGENLRQKYWHTSLAKVVAGSNLNLDFLVSSVRDRFELANLLDTSWHWFSEIHYLNLTVSPPENRGPKRKCPRIPFASIFRCELLVSQRVTEITLFT